MNEMLTKNFLQICLCLFPYIIAAQTFNGISGTIPDNNTWKTFACNVTGLNPNLLNTTFGFEKLTMSIVHNNVSDLEVRLLSPNGTEVLICKNVGGTGNNFTNTGFKNNYTTPITNGVAPFNGSYKPQGDLGLFNNGQAGNGTWLLKVKDSNMGFSGSVTAFSLRFGNGPALPNLPVASNLPIIKINTGGLSIQDEPKISAQIYIINNGIGQINYSNDSVYQYQGQIGIERRGSSSGGMPKKSYGFETWNGQSVEIDTSLLGMPSQSDWILSASYADKSLMRNVLSYDIFNKMGHYASRTQYCEVWLNDIYQGVYILMEKIKRDDNRVRIAKLNPWDTAGAELTGGYIFKIDKNTGSGGSGWSSMFNMPASTTDKHYFQYEYPKDTEIKPQQSTYIKNFVDSFETALAGIDYQDKNIGWRKYANEKTFIDYMLLNEISKNVDGYRISTFLHKEKVTDGNKIKIGPAWDFDIAWYNADYCEGNVTSGWAFNFNYVCCCGVPFWWERMMSDTTFAQNVRCRWNDLRQNTLSYDTLFQYIDSTAALLNEGQQRNFQTWPILGVATWPEPTPNPTTYSAQIQRLKDWIISRFTWLDATINNFPQKDIIVNLGSDTTVCAGSVVNLQAGSFNSYSWSNGTSNNSLNVGQSGIYSITVTDNFKCIGNDAIAIDVIEPIAPKLGNDTTICFNAAILLNATASTSNTYQWNTGDTSDEITVTQPGIYAVTSTDQNNCTAFDNIVINQHAAFVPSLLTDTTICAGQTLELSTGNYATYAWSNGSTANAIVVNSTDTYSLTATNNFGCEGTNQISVIVDALPDASFTFNSITSSTYQFTTSGIGANFEWTFGDGQTANSTSATHTYSQNGVYDVMLTITSANGCVSTSSQQISVIGTRLNQLSNQRFSIFPNPTNDLIYLNWEGTLQINQLTLTNTIGQLVLIQDEINTTKSISMNGLAKGLYYLTIYAEEGVYRTGIVKE